MGFPPDIKDLPIINPPPVYKAPQRFVKFRYNAVRALNLEVYRKAFYLLRYSSLYLCYFFSVLKFHDSSPPKYKAPHQK